ncbi:MAG: hypothetical protein DMG25_17735 [Acidobacteria bacterium]|nr:MAG: hypothetical protein DMG25_17735 [Acidobacteriota bacterium]
MKVMLGDLIARVFVLGFFAAYVIGVVLLLQWIFRTRLRRNRAKQSEVTFKPETTARDSEASRSLKTYSRTSWDSERVC